MAQTACTEPIVGLYCPALPEMQRGAKVTIRGPKKSVSWTSPHPWQGGELPHTTWLKAHAGSPQLSLDPVSIVWPQGLAPAVSIGRDPFLRLTWEMCWHTRELKSVTSWEARAAFQFASSRVPLVVCTSLIIFKNILICCQFREVWFPSAVCSFKSQDF